MVQKGETQTCLYRQYKCWTYVERQFCLSFSSHKTRKFVYAPLLPKPWQEIVSGAQRIHDLPMLIERAKAKGIPLDTIGSYLAAFKHGAEPHGELVLLQ